ncbi:MAG TPA: DJ-1/PfpI family protein [Acidimicrobiales bacterium]|nr:DJ-1/PfpI family protein [Acidimicrobiales bacterium]
MSTQIAIVAFENMAALDAVGPFEVLAHLPNASTHWVGLHTGVVRTEEGAGVGINVDARLEDVPHPDIVVVPGGRGEQQLRDDQRFRQWLLSAHETTTWTTSVCTGSLLLGAAGLLAGKRATSHWLALDTLETFGAEPTLERVVVDGKIITAAGVSSGIDMALTLAALLQGDFVAQTIQLGIEYDPQPPFDAGSPTKAPAAAVDLLRSQSRFLLTGA